MTGDGKLNHDESLGNPVNAKNRERFSAAEWSDVNVMYRILGDSMPSLKGSRDTVWPLLCRAMQVWLKEYEAQRAQIIDTDRPSWVNHEVVYGQWLVALCLRLRWARERWIRALFRSLCMQFQVDTAEALATKLRVCMTRDDSIIYVGFSFRTMRSYYGLVESRAPHERWVEHWRAIRQHQTGLTSNREEKYAYMAANGGINEWFFLPYVSCGKQIELNRLQLLEQSIIRRFPNALNKCRHPAALHRVLQSSVNLDKHAKDVARQANRTGYSDSRVDTEVTYVNSIEAGLEVTHLLNYAMNTCLTIAWHSSYPWSTTQSARRWGDSVVVLLDKAGHSFTGKLRAALTHSARWPAGVRILGFIQRHEHHMQRADDYEYLLAIARHEVPLREACDMLVQ
jgi:hypothetical protein